MAMPPDIIDRVREWGALEKSWRRKRPELLFVVGRRRAGKSYILSRFAAEVGGVYYQATRRSEAEQLAGLTRRIAAHFGDEAVASGASFSNWDALFEYLTRKIGRTRFLLVIDEFPYLAQSAPGLTSVIQRFWDHDWQNSNIRLVLCGSYITAMQQLDAVDQPLFGRRTGKLHFRPFTCPDTSHFVPSWSARDRLRLFGIVGNLPGNLALVDGEASLAENVAELVLDPGGRLVDEAQHILDAFTPHADVHYAILEVIAGGERTWSGLTGRTGKSGGALSRPLAWLEQMEVIERVVPVTEKNPARSKRAMYRLADPYIAFWHAAVAPLLRTGAIGLTDPHVLWREKVEPALDQYMGAVFEQVCREWIAAGEFPFVPFRVGSWWDSSSTNEVDVVSVSADNELFCAECKWGSVSGADLDTLRQRSRLIASELGAGRVHLGLFSGRGEADAAVKEAVARGDVTLFGPEDVASPPGGAPSS